MGELDNFSYEDFINDMLRDKYFGKFEEISGPDDVFQFIKYYMNEDKRKDISQIEPGDTFNPLSVLGDYASAILISGESGWDEVDRSNEVPRKTVKFIKILDKNNIIVSYENAIYTVTK